MIKRGFDTGRTVFYDGDTGRLLGGLYYGKFELCMSYDASFDLTRATGLRAECKALDGDCACDPAMPDNDPFQTWSKAVAAHPCDTSRCGAYDVLALSGGTRYYDPASGTIAGMLIEGSGSTNCVSYVGYPQALFAPPTDPCVPTPAPSCVGDADAGGP